VVEQSQKKQKTKPTEPNSTEPTETEKITTRKEKLQWLAKHHMTIAKKLMEEAADEE
jgi:hypothetical protein